MNEGKVDCVRRTLFRIRWLTMSDKERYAYLWKQTRESLYNGHGLNSRYGSLWRESGVGLQGDHMFHPVR